MNFAPRTAGRIAYTSPGGYKSAQVTLPQQEISYQERFAAACKNAHEQVAGSRGSEKREPSVVAEGDEVQVAGFRGARRGAPRCGGSP